MMINKSTKRLALVAGGMLLLSDGEHGPIQRANAFDLFSSLNLGSQTKSKIKNEAADELQKFDVQLL